MDILTDLCNKIEGCNKDLCEKNKIVCVRKCISEYISGDRDKMMYLKVLVKNHRKFIDNMIPILSFLISGISLLVASISVVMSLFLENDNISAIRVFVAGYILLIFIALLIIFASLIIYGRRNSNTDKLIEYVAVILDDMDKE